MAQEEEVRGLAMKINAMTKKIQELENKNCKMMTNNQRLLRDLELTEKELEQWQDEIAMLRNKRSRSIVTSINAFDVEIHDYWLLPTSHLSIGNKNRVPDDSAARFVHCSKFCDKFKYDTKANFKEFVTKSDVCAYAQRILFVVRRKGIILMSFFF